MGHAHASFFEMKTSFGLAGDLYFGIWNVQCKKEIGVIMSVIIENQFSLKLRASESNVRLLSHTI